MDFINIKDIYKKVAALQRLSENNDNENEAAVALRLAHELAEKYDLTVGQCAAYLKGSKDGRLFMARKLYNCEPSWTRHKSRYTVSMKREPGWEWQRWEKGHCASCAVKLGQRNNTVSVDYPDGDKRGWKAIGSRCYSCWEFCDGEFELFSSCEVEDRPSTRWVVIPGEFNEHDGSPKLKEVQDETRTTWFQRCKKCNEEWPMSRRKRQVKVEQPFPFNQPGPNQDGLFCSVDCGYAFACEYFKLINDLRMAQHNDD